MTRLSNEERKAVIQGFYDRISEGIPIDEQWKRQMIEASAPRLPENPSPEQLDAWIELAELVSDPDFVERLRQSAKEVWGQFDMQAMRLAGDEATLAAKEAETRGVSPESDEARAIVERYGARLAAAKGGSFDADSRRAIRERFERHDAREGRYWELVGVMNGRPALSSDVKAWALIKAAVLHHFV